MKKTKEAGSTKISLSVQERSYILELMRVFGFSKYSDALRFVLHKDMQRERERRGLNRGES